MGCLGNRDDEQQQRDDEEKDPLGETGRHGPRSFTTTLRARQGS
jgi:hypothetical protein